MGFFWGAKPDITKERVAHAASEIGYDMDLEEAESYIAGIPSEDREIILAGIEPMGLVRTEADVPAKIEQVREHELNEILKRRLENEGYGVPSLSP